MQKGMAALCTVVLTGGTALASSDVVTAYRAGVAAIQCDLALDSDRSSRLADVVQRVEQASALAQPDLDALWRDVNAEAEADAQGFCKSATPLVDELIAGAQ
jgi:hypothetical protein